MKILLTHAACRGNKGDSGIVSSMIKELGSQFEGSTFTLETLDLFRTGDTFEGLRQIHSFYYYALCEPTSQFFRYIRSIWIVAITLFWSTLVRYFNFKMKFGIDRKVLETLLEYSNSDIIIPVGGGYLTAKPGIKNTSILYIMRILPMTIAVILKKPLFLYSQSIGPFGNSIQRFLTWSVIKHAKAIFVRESISHNLMLSYGYPKERLFLVPDTAFLFDSDSGKMKGYFKSKPRVVGITVRLWFEEGRQIKFERHIADFSLMLLKLGYDVAFLPQADCTNHKDDDDRDVVRRIEKIIGRKPNVHYIYDSLDHYQIKELYKELYALVGMRMHSNIFALSSNIPCVAIAYEYKTEGIMRDLGLSKWSINAEDVTPENLFNIFRNLESNRDIYLQQLNKSLPDYKKQISKIPTVINEIISGRTVKLGPNT